MEFSITALSPETAKTGCVVAGVHTGKELTPPAKRIDQASRGALRKALDDLQEKTGSTLLLRGLPGVAAEREEAEEGDHRVGRKLAAGRAAEQSHELRRERDHEQRHEHRAGKAGEFPEQRALKDHAILSLWNLA